MAESTMMCSRLRISASARKSQTDVDGAGFVEFLTPNVAQRQPGKADAQRLEASQQPMLDKREVDIE
jgi:hypothetical protein